MRCFTLVCFDCRRAIRSPRGVRNSPARCAVCRADLKLLSHKVRIPARTAKEEWEGLFKRLMAGRIREVSRRQADAVRRQHDLEKQIGSLKQRPSNAGRSRLLRELELKLATLKAKS